MPTQGYPYIALGDGTTTIVFADGAGGATNYPLVMDTWAPEIAARRDNVLGGQLQYTDVIETIAINIRDTTAAGCYACLATLAALLEQADRYWRLGEPVAPVTFRYAPQGSTLASTATPYQAMVLGRAKEDQTSGVKLSAVYNRIGMLYEILGVQLVFVRHGVFSLSFTSVSSANGPTSAKRLATFGASIAVPSAVDVQIGGVPNTSGTFTGWRASVLLTGKASNDLSVIEAETGAAGNWTSVADAAAKASGNILRYTPVAITADRSGVIGHPIGTPSRIERAVIVAMVRNNSGTTTFQLRATVKTGNVFVSSTPYQVIDTVNYTAPTPVILGQVAWDGNASSGRLYLEASASAVAGSLDIDVVVFQPVRGEENAALTLAAVSTAGGAASNTISLGMNPTTQAAPVVRATLDSVATPLTYAGALPVYTSGTTMYLCWLVGNNAYWRLTDGAGTLAGVQFNLNRYDGYLVPQ